MTLLNLIENDNKEKIPVNVDGKIKLTEKIIKKSIKWQLLKLIIITMKSLILMIIIFLLIIMHKKLIIIVRLILKK